MEEPITFIIGYGWGVYDTMSSMGVFRFATHNTYLTYFFDLGIVGLGLFLVLVSNVIRVTRKGVDKSKRFTRVQLMVFLFGFLSLLVALFFGNLHKPWLFVWAYIGLMMRVAVEAPADRALINARSDGHDFPDSYMRLPK